MSKETIRQTIDQIKTTDSMKAVKVAFDLSESNQDSITKIMKIVHGNVNNINLLGDKVLKLEKKIEELEAHVEAYANREI
jgi:predicted  nucleic acid-binding Zn-ribbon protein